MKKEISLTLFILIIVFIILELIFRLVWVNDAWWGEFRSAIVYQYPINEYGFRDFDYEQQKPEDTIRIVCLGDSFTAGDGIKFDDTFPKRLERSLNYFLGPENGKKYEVLNISWCGYSTFQEIDKLGFVNEWQPDLIILGYCLNDTEDWADPKGVLALRHKYLFKKKPNKFLRFFYNHSYFISFVGNRLCNLWLAVGNKKYYRRIYEDSYVGWIRSKESFQILSKQDIPVLVLIFPLLSYDMSRYPFLDIHEKVKSELEKNNLIFIDFYYWLKDEERIRLQAVPYRNPHPSEIANRIIEETIYDKLKGDYKEVIKYTDGKE